MMIRSSFEGCFEDWILIHREPLNSAWHRAGAVSVFDDDVVAEVPVCILDSATQHTEQAH